MFISRFLGKLPKTSHKQLMASFSGPTTHKPSRSALKLLAQDCLKYFSQGWYLTQNQKKVPIGAPLHYCVENSVFFDHKNFHFIGLKKQTKKNLNEQKTETADKSQEENSESQKKLSENSENSEISKNSPPEPQSSENTKMEIDNEMGKFLIFL